MDPESKRRPGQGASPVASVAGQRSDAASLSRPRWDGEADLRRHAELLFDRPGRVVEVRALGVGGKGVLSGYFDDPSAFVREVLAIDGAADGVYATLNPVRPELLARSCNRLRRPGKTTGDRDVLERRFLFVDVDAVRPSGISANEDEKRAATQVAEDVAAYLAGLGFPPPVRADSGNGAHLLYSIELPADDGRLVQRCLEALAFRYDTERARIDTAVSNAARLCRVYGTVARKGDSVADRPHRRARLLAVPNELEVVPLARLEAVADAIPATARPGQARVNGHGRGVDVDAFLALHGIPVDRDGPWSGGRRWVLEACPFVPDHSDRSAYVVQFGNGAVAAGCHHESCSWRWADLRERFEPGETRPAAAPRIAGHGSAPSTGRPTTWQPLDFRPFPTDALPQPVRRFVRVGAESIACDESYVALPLLASLASAIGNTRTIRLKRGWTEPAILWTAVVGESGTLKSPAQRLALSPLTSRQRAALAEYDEQMAAYEAEKRAFSARRRSRDRDDDASIEPPTCPVAARFYCSDITVEALAVLLRAQPRGLLVARDELSGWFRSFDAYRKGRGGDSAHWLEMHCAGELLVDRKTDMRGAIHVPRAAVSITGGIQPEVLRSTLGHEHRVNGMAPRLLLAMPPRRPKVWTDAEVDEPVAVAIDRLFGDLLALAVDPTAAHPGAPVEVGMTEDGLAAWIRFSNEHADEQTSRTGLLASTWSKIEGYAARLALVVHCIRSASASSRSVAAELVDADSVEAGVALARWFAHEAERVHAVFGEGSEDRALRQLAELVAARGGHVSVRELMRSGRLYPTAEEGERALQVLVDRDLGTWRRSSAGSAGRPTKRFHLHSSPAVDVDETPSVPLP